MKHTFKKVVVLALTVIMCLSAIMPSATAATTTCPGQGATHTAYNCTYTEGASSAAKCDAAGSVLGVCNDCGDKFILRTVEATGHDWEYSAADCDTASYRTCKTCKKVELVKAAAGHAWGDWVVTGGVCRVGEQRVQTCTVCGVKNVGTMTEEHSWVVDEFVAPERCGLPGYSVYVCANKCGAERSEEVWLYGVGGTHPATDKWISWADAYAAKLVDVKDDPNYAKQSCTVEGRYTVVCPDCGITKVINLGTSSAHDSTDIGKRLQFVDYVAEDLCTKAKGTHAYWKCYDCGALYQAAGATRSTTPVKAFGTDDIERIKSYEYTYSKTEIGAAVKDNSVANVLPINDLPVDHAWAGPEPVAATCTTAGYSNRLCVMCGKTENTSTAALGHLFAPDVTSDHKAVAKRIAEANSVTWTGDGGFDWKQVMAHVNDNTYFRTEGTPATCTTAGKYEWRCLRSGCYGVEGVEGRKEVVVPATGHNFSTTEKNNTANDEPTCTRPGVDKFICYNGCGMTNNVAVPALGHKIKVDTKAATCAEEGKITETCENGCGMEPVITVLPKDPNNHAWTDVSSMPKKAENCTEDGYGTRYCSNCSIDPVAYTTPATGHKYLEGAELAEAIKSLAREGATFKNNNNKVVVTYLQSGDCTKVAKYKLACVNKTCEMFTSYEVSEGFNIGGHDIDIVYRNNAGDATTGLEKLLGVNGTYNYSTVVPNRFSNFFGQFASDNFSGLHNSDNYGQKAPSGHMTRANAVVSGNNYYWYCKNEGCPMSRTAADPMHKESIDANADGHFIRKEDGNYRTVTLTDVPDEKISKVLYDKAKDVKAPVDENGNIIAVAIDIPGTTLVWRYKLDAKDAGCEYDEVEKGGFWCVECQAPYGETGAGCTVGTKRGHDLPTVGQTVRADCQNYGYVRFECEFAGCDYAVVTEYVKATDHTFELVNNDPSNDVKPTCLLDGYRFLECTLCKITKVDVPANYKATGHKNNVGDPLSTSCLSGATITNRFCVSCSTVIVSDHAYDANNTCIYCGRTKQN